MQDLPELVVEAGKSERQYWRDIWHFRSLFYFLAWRDILVRYKQTVIGIAWAVIRPVLTMAIMTFVFYKVAKIDPGDIPPPILVFSAMLPWQFFASALSQCSESLVGNANLVSKIYFPRLIVPASSVIVSLVDFLISSVILAAMMMYYGFAPGWGILALPLMIVLAFGAAMGIGIWFASLNVRYRDFRHIVPFAVQIGMYISPVAYKSDLIPEHLRLLYSVNPMVGVIDGFRWAILGEPLYLPGIAISAGFVIVSLWLGIKYFRSTERTFADVI